MGDKKSRQLFTIIICLALVVAVIFSKIFLKDDKEDNIKVKESNVNQEANDITDMPADEKELTETDQADQEVVENHSIDYTPIDEVDTGLYQEETESESAQDGVVVQIALTNGDILYNGGYPSGVFKNMMVDYQSYINENIKNPEEIKEITIQEESVIEDKENKKLQYDVTLNDGTKLAVEVDLYTFDYIFKKK